MRDSMTGEDVAWIFFYLFFIVVFTALAVYQYFMRKGIRHRIAGGHGLTALAASVGGRVERSSGRPELRFERHGRPWILREELVGKSLKPLTTIEIRAGADGFLVAASRNSYRFPAIPPRTRAVSGPKDAFGIHASDTGWAQRLLADGLLALLQDLSRRAGDSVHVRLTTSTALIEVESLLAPNQIETLLQDGDRLVGIAGADAPAGAVDVLEVSDTPAGVCQVCSSPMDGAVVRCGVCRTPHHADCWEYLGRCSTYGCAGSRAE